VSIITIWGGGGEEGVDIYVELTNEIPGLWQVSGNHTQICDVRFSGQMSATLTNLSYRPQQLSQKGEAMCCILSNIVFILNKNKISIRYLYEKKC
jgi:hypothetical protein